MPDLIPGRFDSSPKIYMSMRDNVAALHKGNANP